MNAPEAKTDKGRRGWVVATVLLSIALAVSLCLISLFATTYFPRPMNDLDVRDTPAVVTGLRDLARLETASAHVERVIDIRDRQSRLFGAVEAEDAILLVAAGDVVAGVDLTTLTDGDIVVESGAELVHGEQERLYQNVVVTLPMPIVFSARLDNARTYVHTRDTDALARRNETLETRARQEAESTLQAAALDNGLLTRAQANAETTISALLRSLGFDHVTIQWRETPVAAPTGESR